MTQRIVSNAILKTANAIKTEVKTLASDMKQAAVKVGSAFAVSTALGAFIQGTSLTLHGREVQPMRVFPRGK